MLDEGHHPRHFLQAEATMSKSAASRNHFSTEKTVLVFYLSTYYLFAPCEREGGSAVLLHPCRAAESFP